MHGALLDEAALTNRLNHPHLVDVIECARTSDGTPYFVMPYYPGDLAHELWGSFMPQALSLPIKSARAIKLLKQIFSALSVIHDFGVVHRDIKPQNVLLDEQGNAVLCDLGHAKNPCAITPPRIKNYGTPPFISPEQCKNPSTVDRCADIYSLGVMAYFMLTGMKPADETVPPNDLDGMIDSNFSLCVMQMMHADPAQRLEKIDAISS